MKVLGHCTKAIIMSVCCIHALSAMDRPSGILVGFPGDEYPAATERLLPLYAPSASPAKSNLQIFRKKLKRYGLPILAVATVATCATVGYFARNQIIQGVSELQQGSGEMQQACTQTGNMCTAATQTCQELINDMYHAGLLAQNCSTLLLQGLSKCPLQAYALVKCLDE